jgi:hypothetical protein
VDGDRIFLAGDAAFASSEDGLHWNFHSIGAENTLFDLTSDPNGYVAVGSAPGVDPTNPLQNLLFRASTPSGFTVTPCPRALSIEYGNGVYVAAYTSLYVSTNAKSWRVVYHQDGSPFDTDLHFVNGRFLYATGGAVLSSTNGLAWSKSEDVRANKLSYYNGVYAAASPGKVSFSTDAIHWETYEVPAPNPVRGIALGPAGVVVIGDSLGKPAAEALFSPDRKHWTRFSLPFPERACRSFSLAHVTLWLAVTA